MQIKQLCTSSQLLSQTNALFACTYRMFSLVFENVTPTAPGQKTLFFAKLKLHFLQENASLVFLFCFVFSTHNHNASANRHCQPRKISLEVLPSSSFLKIPNSQLDVVGSFFYPELRSHQENEVQWPRSLYMSLCPWDKYLIDPTPKRNRVFGSQLQRGLLMVSWPFALGQNITVVGVCSRGQLLTSRWTGIREKTGRG